MSVTNLTDALASFAEHWQPRRVASVNDYDMKIAKIAAQQDL